MDKKICPNCRKKELMFLAGEWVCLHCEFHTHEKKPAKGIFR